MSYTFNHPITCCKSCVAPKRHPGCHGHCPEYLAERAVYEAKKAEVDKLKAIRDGLDNQAINAEYRAKRKQGKAGFKYGR